MYKFRSGLVAVLGFGIALVTLRRLRNRRTDPREEAEAAAQTAVTEAETAVEHAKVAVEHAGIAAQKAVEYAREEMEAARDTVESDDEPAVPEPVGRLRKAGKGWIRR